MFHMQLHNRVPSAAARSVKAKEGKLGEEMEVGKGQKVQYKQEKKNIYIYSENLSFVIFLYFCLSNYIHNKITVNYLMNSIQQILLRWLVI